MNRTDIAQGSSRHTRHACASVGYLILLAYYIADSQKEHIAATEKMIHSSQIYIYPLDIIFLNRPHHLVKLL